MKNNMFIKFALVLLITILHSCGTTSKIKGKVEQITDSKGEMIVGSISTIERIILGGQEQYLIIRGTDTTKPVMLYLHGGPGSSEFAFMKKMNPEIENNFTMVYWEQRGAGKSYSKTIPIESMNVAQFISDTKELSEILAKRFNREKIYLMGHSWGAFLGILTAHQYPELFHAYFGIGQVCDQFKGEQISYEWVKEQANKNNDHKAIKALSNIQLPNKSDNIEIWFDYMATERKYVNQFGGGILHEMSGMWQIFKIILKTKEYSFGEKMNYSKSNKFSFKHPKGTPLKHNKEKQCAFKEKYFKIKKHLDFNEKIFFIDSVHPTQATKITSAWIRAGVEKIIATVADRKRVNLTGAVNIENMTVFTKDYETINGHSTIDFLKYLDESTPETDFIQGV